MIDTEKNNQVKDLIDTLIEAGQYMSHLVEKKNYKTVYTIADDMICILEEIYSYSIELKEKYPYISSSASCKNAIASIKKIVQYLNTRSLYLSNKINFELLPILEDFKYDFYFFTEIFGDKEREKVHYENEAILMLGNHYIDKSMITNEYKYDISICVLAYNKIEYTKMCIESILRYTPKDINYELILIDNGSNDGTLEYFESLAPTKIFRLEENNLNIVVGATARIFEGRYILSISNDVIVTENYLDNLITCMEEQTDVGMIVPTTPNVSNYQAINAEYNTLEEMHKFAKKHNTSKPELWEERVRLCNPLTFVRADIFCSSLGVSVVDKYFVYAEFSDDALALRIRRAGYKLILAKDCYCYHFGSVTLNESRVKDNTLKKSRQLFIDRYGVDAWSTGFCYDMNLVNSLNIKLLDKITILGINSGFGSNPVKIKSLCREYGNTNIELFFETNDERYIPDLKCFSNNVRNIIEQEKYNNKFDYIILEDNSMNYLRSDKKLAELKERLTANGVLCIYILTSQLNVANKLKPNKIITGKDGSWLLW